MTGRIEIISGPMFSGKSEELIRRIKRARFAKQKYLIFKPKIDNRYSETKIVSHDGNSEDAIVIESSVDILIKARRAECQVVAIEEAQFLDGGLLRTALALKGDGVKVIIGGLDMNYLGNPFYPMPELMAVADKVSKLKAVCKCGRDATHTHRRTNTTDVIEVGGVEIYEPMCYNCWNDNLC
jgi:thymidine kinase